jgi:uncharacterized protein YcfJ
MTISNHPALSFRQVCLGMAVWCLSLATVSQGYAQMPNSKAIIYPSKGQTPAIQDKDTAECNLWAQNQTGFDPTAALKAQQGAAADAQNHTQTLQNQRATVGGEALGGAARGAIAGVAIGAVAGNAGKGAAIGATAGAFNGRARNRAKHRQIDLAEAQARDRQAQQQTANNQKFADYQKATAACMEGRGYVVK